MILSKQNVKHFTHTQKQKYTHIYSLPNTLQKKKKKSYNHIKQHIRRDIYQQSHPNILTTNIFAFSISNITKNDHIISDHLPSSSALLLEETTHLSLATFCWITTWPTNTNQFTKTHIRTDLIYMAHAFIFVML